MLLREFFDPIEWTHKSKEKPETTQSIPVEAKEDN